MIIPLANSISNSILDYDARQFINVCGITNSVTIRAINDCFKKFKSEDIWNRIYYGFAMVSTGGSASMLVDIKSRQSINLYTPNSGITASATFSSTGVQFNRGQFLATSDYVFDFIINSDAAPGHISIYNRTNYSSLGITGSSKHGFRESFGGYEQSITFTSGTVSGSLWNKLGPMGFSSSSTSGFFLFSNINDNNGLFANGSNPYVFYMSRNGQILGTQSSETNSHKFGSRIMIGAFGDNFVNPESRSVDEISWYSIGSGFGENSPSGRQIDIGKQENFFQIVKNLQIALNRAVDI